MTIDINRRSLARGAAVALLVAAVAVAGYFVGVSTRMSDAARAREKTTAVLAEQRKGAKTIANVKTLDAAHERRAVKAAVTRAVRRTRKVERRRAKKRAEAARQAGYSSGNTAGYSSGHSAGEQQGYTSGHDAGLADGSDSLICSDDPDVYWLPAC